MFLNNIVKLINIFIIFEKVSTFNNKYYNDFDKYMYSPSVYYNVSTKEYLRVCSIENSFANDMLPEDDHTSTKTTGINRRVSYRSNGCTCQQLTCGCCVGLNIQQINFNREGCTNLTYDPLEFSIGITMLLDNQAIFMNKISAKNPPALCIPIPYIPGVDFCVKVFDIYTPGQNLHMCLDFETRIQTAPVLVLHFDCMKMGTDGIALVKPGIPPSTVASTTTSQLGSDIYDEVTEIKY